MEVNETATTVTYKIDDRTGPWVEARKWMDDQVCVCQILSSLLGELWVSQGNYDIIMTL